MTKITSQSWDEYQDSKKARDKAMDQPAKRKAVRWRPATEATAASEKTFTAAKQRNSWWKELSDDERESIKLTRREVRKAQTLENWNRRTAEIKAEREQKAQERTERLEKEKLEKELKAQQRRDELYGLAHPDPEKLRAIEKEYLVKKLPDGRHQIHLDDKTVITLKPGAIPADVIQKFMSRNSSY